MKKRVGVRLWILGLLVGAACAVQAQDVVMSEAAAKAETLSEGSGFIGVVASGGFLGVVLWLALAAL